MIRESLEAGSKHATMAVDSGPAAARSSSAAAPAAPAPARTASGTAVQAPYWVRITRTGNNFKAESSPDGKTWTALGTDQSIQMVANVYIGLCVTSHNAVAYTTAEFSNVTTARSPVPGRTPPSV